MRLIIEQSLRKCAIAAGASIAMECALANLREQDIAATTVTTRFVGAIVAATVVATVAARAVLIGCCTAARCMYQKY